MIPRRRVSRAAIELIARFEGYRRMAARLPQGGWTIGYGHTLTAREGAEVSRDDAEALLLYDLIGVAHAINEHVYAPLTQNQFDALASFAFNIGVDAVLESGVLKRLNEGALLQGACAMELWRKAEFGGEIIVIDALVRRRAAEKALFMTPEGGWPAAPSPVLRPRLDDDATRLVPAERPAEVAVSLEGETVQATLDGAPAPRPAVPEEDEVVSPVQAAAEAVVARLQSVYAEPPPQAEDAAESAQDTIAEPPEFRLTAPAEDAGVSPAPTPHPLEEAEGPPSGELFPETRPVETVVVEIDSAETETARVLIDDTAPYEFVAPIVQPLPAQPRGGPLSLVALAVLGLAFIGGGLFWALNAKAGSGGGLFTPLLVGWLAGLAGVGLVSVAVYLVLQGLARGGEDDDD